MPISIHAVDGYISKLYLLEYEHGLLLLDCGCRGDVGRIESFCRERLGRPANDIRLAIVTHMHPDHAGGAVLLRRRFGTPIAAPDQAERWYAGITGFIQHKLDCLMAQFVAASNRQRFESTLFRRKLRPDFTLKDGDNLPFFNDWQVLTVPGHTSHDIVLFNPGSGVLYAADMLCEVKDVFQPPIPVKFPGRMKRSYRRLAALDVSETLLAHGRRLCGAEAAQAFRNAARQLDLPPGRIIRRTFWLTNYSPEVWKPYLKKFLRNRN